MKDTSGKVYLKAITNIGVALFAFLVVILVVPKIAVYFSPFIVGAIIAWLASPLVAFFERHLKIKRKAGSAVVIILVLAAVIFALYFLISFLVTEISGLINDIPSMWITLERQLDQIGQHYEKIFAKLPADVRTGFMGVITNIEDYFTNSMGNISSPAIEFITDLASHVPTVLISIIMAVLSSYLFVSEKSTFLEDIKRVTPNGIYNKITLVWKSMKQAVGGYFKAQFKIEFWVFLITLTGLLILGIKYSVLIALGIAFLDLLPFFGAGAAMIPWAVIQLLSGEYILAIGLLIVWGIGQVVRQVIQPKIMGDSMGLPPIPTLVLLFLGFKIGGALGMIFALPIGIIVYNLFEAGVFENTINSFKLLIIGINTFRRLNEKDLEPITTKEQDENLKIDLDNK